MDGRSGFRGQARMAAVALATPEVTRYEYAEVESRVGMLAGNGVVTTYEYREQNRLTGVAHRDPAQGPLARYEYSLRADRRRVGRDPGCGTAPLRSAALLRRFLLARGMRWYGPA